MATIKFPDGTTMEATKPTDADLKSAQEFSGTTAPTTKRKSGATPATDTAQAMPQGQPNSMLPQGLDMTNMLGFARTPAGQQLLRNLMARMQGNRGQM